MNKFTVGDILSLTAKAAKVMSAGAGSTALCEGHEMLGNTEYVRISWIKLKPKHGSVAQPRLRDGLYYDFQFTRAKENQIPADFPNAVEYLEAVTGVEK